MRITTGFLLLCTLSISAYAQQSNPDVKQLERKLDEAIQQLEQLTTLIQSLRRDISRLKGETPTNENRPSDPKEQSTQTPIQQSSPSAETSADHFVARIIEPGLGQSEREETFRAKPEIFIQARYSALPIRDAGDEFEPNLSLTRIETRWSGKVRERLGAGLEIQFHPAIDGSAEELVNDAFIEYYINDYTTVRVGQFVKPFGFDIQQSSVIRESPERAIFAGYFFPGQRDRGVLLSGDLRWLGVSALRDVQYFVGAFNGNRFFTDNNRQLNYLARVRKLLGRRFAVGVSAQKGKQILPPGVFGTNDEDILGIDFQLAVTNRLGLRGEFARGNTPSTLLAIEPEFAPGFRPGAPSGGGHLFATYKVNDQNNIYARFDGFNNDPVTSRNVRAFNFGYFRQVGNSSRISFDYQFKNRPSFNDDAVNGRLNITWGIEF
ncbi:MAG TPA: porin [Pyrinomonadaceae bacterium]|nr:porin [Pyrinomonadaceae bacterium]